MSTAKLRLALFAAHFVTLFVTLLGALALVSGAAHAESYPSGTVKLIVPVPAGGVTDTMARIVGQRLTELWGQPVVVDNRPGGNYAVGAQAVAKSPPDGLTLLVAPDSTVTANPNLFSKLPYDPLKDLTHRRLVPDHAGAGDQSGAARAQRAGADRGRLRALGRADQGGRRQARLRYGGRKP